MAHAIARVFWPMSLGLVGVATGCGRGKPIEAARGTPPATPVVWRDPSPHAVKFVTVGQGVRIEVLDWGGDGEPLVFLNGLGNTAHIFDDFAPRFTDRFHVLALTRPGWGASGHPQQGYSIPVLVEDVHAVLDSLHIARADFAGHSIAGQELTWLAAEYPAQVDRLVYLDAGFDYHAHPGPEGFPDPPAPGPADSASVEAALAYTRRMSNVATPEADFRATERFSPAGRFLGDATPSAISDSVYRSAKATAPPYVRVHGPVLAIYNAPQTVQQFVPWIAPTDTSRAAWLEAIQTWYRVQRENLVRAVPQAKVIVLPGAGHYVFLGQPDSVASAMRTFLLAPSK
jgi:non-heme chloroperoxidase